MLRAPRQSDGYQGYADLARAYAEGRDYRVICMERPGSCVAIIGPHGGKIERGTSDVAKAIAANDFHLYLLEGTRESGNFDALHLTSTRFDEPRCLQLLSISDQVVTIHGCVGKTPEVQIGGLDTELKLRIRCELAKSHVAAVLAEGRFAARQPSNICNRGRRAIGVQLELSRGLRLSGDTGGVVTAVRAALLG
jgi:phage replication-related protein YjqB (UPF0714/DUF867 family)